MSIQKTNEELVAEIQSGTNANDNKVQLFRQNRGFIIMIAKKYTTDNSPDLEDFLSVGYLALDEACRVYDTDRGAKFATVLLWCLHRAYKQYVSKCRLVGIPYHLQENIVKYSRERRRMLAETGRDPTDEEISRESGIRPETIGLIKQAKAVSAIKSLDYSMQQDGGDGISLSDMLTDDYDLEESTVQSLYNSELSRIWDVLPEILSQKQAEVIIGIYRDGLSVVQIAKATGRTHQAVDSLKRHAMKKLYYNRQLLKPFYNSMCGID